MTPREFCWALAAFNDEVKRKTKERAAMAIWIGACVRSYFTKFPIRHIYQLVKFPDEIVKAGMTKAEWKKRQKEINKMFDDFKKSPKRRVVRIIECDK